MIEERAAANERAGNEKAQMGIFLNALKANPVATQSHEKSLIYVEASGKKTQVMVDTGASHNFIKKEGRRPSG